MSSFSNGQMNQLGNSLERAGFTPNDVTKLGQSKEVLGGILKILRGQAEINFLNI